MSSLKHRLFIVPAGDIPARYPAFMELVGRWEASWIDAVYTALTEVMEFANGGNLGLLIQDTTDVLEARYGEELAHNFLAACDVPEEAFSAFEHEEAFFLIVTVMREILQRTIYYIRHYFEGPTSSGMVSEVVIQRLVGNDIVFRVTYLTF